MSSISCYRDPVRSSRKHVVKCFGLKWVCLVILVPVPWSQRVWALYGSQEFCAPNSLLIGCVREGRASDRARFSWEPYER